jgi:hypothetical protein
LGTSAILVLDLADHGHGLGDCTQADIDRWFAAASRTEQDLVRPLLTWAIRRHLTRRLRLPPVVRPAVAPISQTQRLELIRRVHDDDSIPLQDRVVALLILLYAQPLIKIAGSPWPTSNSTLARFGCASASVRRCRSSRRSPPCCSTTSPLAQTRPPPPNPASTLLFPGRRAGQPIHPGSQRLRLHRLGIPNINGRTRAIRELLIQAPPRSSLACSATTRPVLNCLLPRPVQPGNVTHRAITRVMASRGGPA